MSCIEELNLYANSKIAKSVATIFVAFFVCYHGMLHAMDGGDTCIRLLSDGRFQGSSVWQPYGCMLHSYSNVDARRCMRYVAFLKEDNHIVFIGDSRMRQLYYFFNDEISTKKSPKPPKAHQDLHYNETQLSLFVDFYWVPIYSNETLHLLNKIGKGKALPKLIVLGGATHNIKNYNGSEEGLIEYQNALSNLAPKLDSLGNQTRVLWVLQDPVVADRLAPSRKAITNDQIDLYNKAAMEILQNTKVELWSSSRLIAHGLMHDFEDGLHAGPHVMNYDAQILLNLYCNDHLNYNDGTCCNSREAFTLTQIVVFATLCTCSILFIVIAFKQLVCAKEPDHIKYFLVSSDPENNGVDSRQATPSNYSTKDFLMAIGKLGLIMCYFFLCDRTNFFMKENKYYSHLNFWLPVGYIVALGLFFTEDTSQTRILHKDITYEWRGWMQLMIMIYHMTGASHILPIYMHVRILVSAYLFLMGFRHFNLYWIGHEFGLVLYFQTMFRLNFLTIILCFLMNRPYQFYYYVVLVSFWYTVLYVSLVCPPRLQKPAHANSEHPAVNYVYCILKILGMGSFITVLYLSEVFFEKIFVVRFWKSLFVTADDDIHEWWFRWKLDRYSILYGMILGLLYQAGSQFGIFDDKSGSNLLTGRLAFLLSLASSFCVFSYGILTYFSTSKADCDEIHPYLVWLPLLGYTFLRNIIGCIRTRYSSFFAWFGMISLELFVCQYHIWLAADTHGVLVLIPSYPVANILLTSFIFVCAAHEIHHITNVMVTFIVPFDTIKTFRNLSVFVVFLITIAIHNGIV